MKKAIIYISFLLLALPCSTIAQSKSKYEPEDAEEHFKHNNFMMAIPVYKELLKSDGSNYNFNYKLGLCYLNTNIKKSEAIPYLEKAVKNAKAEPDAQFYLAKAYHYDHKWDKAIELFQKYIKAGGGKKTEEAEREIEMCNNGKELSKYPINVTFQNLGAEINSGFPDYYPFVTADESMLVYTSRRKQNIGGSLEVDGYYASDIYFSTPKEGKWQLATNVGAAVNTRYDEQAVGITADGQKMIVYLDHIDSLGNIYISIPNPTNGKFKKVSKLDKNVNSDFETSGYITPDGSTLFFASKRDDGMGGTDIYLSRVLPNGKWSLAQNLGPKINTKYNEDFPVLAPDGKTLYFSSQGHSSIGDFDLFKAQWQNPEGNDWSEPVNLGFPLNTADDNRSISFSKDDRAGYISATRDGGFGDLDIWRVVFNDNDQRYTTFSGYVLTADSTKREIDAMIVATNMGTTEELSFKPSTKDGKYIMALPPGKYTISIEAPGYKTYVESILVFDLGSFIPETKKNFQMLPGN